MLFYCEGELSRISTHKFRLRKYGGENPLAGNLTLMTESLSNLLSENRTFPPSAEFAQNANAKADIYDEAERDRLAFWEKQASRLHWFKKDRKSTRLNSSHPSRSRMPSSA